MDVSLLKYHRPKGTFVATRPRVIAAGLFYVLALVGPALADFTVHVSSPGTITFTSDAAVTPVPVPSPMPTASAPPAPVITGAITVTRPYDVQNMTEISPGVWRSNNLGSDQKCALFFAPGVAIKPGDTVLWSYKRRTNVPIGRNSNDKIDRSYLAFAKPNGYDGKPIAAGSNALITFVEGGAPVSIAHDAAGNVVGPWNRAYYVYPNAAGQLVPEVRTFTYSSGPGKGDGHLRISLGGQTLVDDGRWMSDSVATPGTRNMFCPQMVYAPNSGDAGPFPADSYVEFSDVSLAVIPK